MFKQLRSVFLESRCPLCARTTAETICTYCQRKLKSHQLNQWDDLWRGDLPVFAWGKYDGQLKRAIAILKYNNQPEIGRILGQWLGKAWLDSSLIKPKQKITVIPIPLHSKKLQDRGFNQAEVIAKNFCKATGYLLNAQGLIRTRNTKVMFGLNPVERTENLKDAFRVGQKISQSPVLLLDDIYTAGTTVKEAAKVLRQQDIKVAGVIVAAKTSQGKRT